MAVENSVTNLSDILFRAGFDPTLIIIGPTTFLFSALYTGMFTRRPLFGLSSYIHPTAFPTDSIISLITKACPLAPNKLIVSIKKFHCSRGGRINILAFYYFFEGGENDFAVGEEGDVVDIPDVELEFLFP